MASEETNLSYKYSGINGGQVCNFQILEKKIFDINTSSGRQFDCPLLPDKIRRHSQQASPVCRHNDLAIYVVQTDRDYCRITTF